jgi:hypothetical protein
MYIFCEKNQSSTTLPSTTIKKKFFKNAKKALKAKANSKKYL